MILAGLLISCGIVWAEGLDEQYVHIYGLIEQGDLLRESGDPTGAFARYSEAQNALQRFDAANPGWNPKIIQYRLNYLSEQITKISAHAATVKKAGPVLSTTHYPKTNAAPNGIGDIEARAEKLEALNHQLESQVAGLTGELKGLQENKVALEAKLREAFAAQPPPVSSSELANALQSIRQLQKENDLLKVSLAQATNAPAKPVAESRQQIKRELSDARAKIGELTKSNAILQNEHSLLLAKFQKPSTSDPAVEALRSENDILKNQLAKIKSSPASVSADGREKLKLQEAETALAVLRSEKEMLRMDKLALEQKLKESSQSTSATATSVSAHDAAYEAKIKALEHQRDELQGSLAKASQKSTRSSKTKSLLNRMDEMSREIAGLKASIEVLQAKPVPYSQEELALLAKPSSSSMVAVHKAKSKKDRDPSPKAIALLSKAKSLYVAHDNGKAEEMFQEALKLDPENFEILADLGSVQLDLGKIPEAESNVKKALQQQPEDYFSLYVLGQIQFQQKRYDEALQSLGRASKITPQNANVENFIGLTLSEKGMRAQAEAAFRTAILLEPDFAEAHLNLAVVYVTQTPPLFELARWHYDKAMKAGHERNPKLEELIHSAATSIPSQSPNP